MAEESDDAVHLLSDAESEPDQPADPEGTEAQQISPELQPLRRFTRQKSGPDYYAQQSHLTESPTYKEATTSTEIGKWQQPLEAKIKSLEDNHVWDLACWTQGCWK